MYVLEKNKGVLSTTVITFAKEIETREIAGTGPSLIAGIDPSSSIGAAGPT